MARLDLYARTYGLASVSDTTNTITTVVAPDGTINGAVVEAGSVDTAALANDAVTTAKIDDAAVTTAKINDDAVTLDKVANTVVAVEPILITNGQVLNLNSTPATLLPAYGANTVTEIVSVVLKYNYVTAAFTIGSATNLQVKYTDASGAAITTTQAVTGMLDQTTNQLRLLPLNGTAYTPVANAAVVLSLAGANVTGGGGFISGYITYRVHTLT